MWKAARPKLTAAPVLMAITVTAARIARPVLMPRSLMIISRLATHGTKSVITVSGKTECADHDRARRARQRGEQADPIEHEQQRRANQEERHRFAEIPADAQ